MIHVQSYKYDIHKQFMGSGYCEREKRARSKREIAEIYFTFQEIPFLILPSILIKNKAESLCF